LPSASARGVLAARGRRHEVAYRRETSRARAALSKTSDAQRIVLLTADRHAEALLRRARDGTAPDPKGVHVKLYLLRHPAGLAAFLTFAAFDAAYRLCFPQMSPAFNVVGPEDRMHADVGLGVLVSRKRQARSRLSHRQP
jgi:hypothetical protein